MCNEAGEHDDDELTDEEWEDFDLDFGDWDDEDEDEDEDENEV